jgi:hypothetical protein
MYMFGKNGNEVVVGDYVYFNNRSLNKIGKIVSVYSDSGDLIIKDRHNGLHYKRSLESLRRLPETVWSLLILEK